MYVSLCIHYTNWVCLKVNETKSVLEKKIKKNDHICTLHMVGQMFRIRVKYDYCFFLYSIGVAENSFSRIESHYFSYHKSGFWWQKEYLWFALHPVGSALYLGNLIQRTSSGKIWQLIFCSTHYTHIIGD